MKCSIEINGLRLFARHGVMEQEKHVGNLFEVTAEIFYPFEKAMEEDQLEHTLNYAEAVEVIRSEMEISSLTLEHVAGRIRQALLTRFPLIEGGSIKITKITPPISAELDGVAVKISW